MHDIEGLEAACIYKFILGWEKCDGKTAGPELLSTDIPVAVFMGHF